MRDRVIVGPLLSLYWWLRDYPATKTPADLRLEAVLWQLAGHRDIARICRLQAEANESRYVRLERWELLDVVGLALVLVLVVVTVAMLAEQVVRWAI